MYNPIASICCKFGASSAYNSTSTLKTVMLNAKIVKIQHSEHSEHSDVVGAFERNDVNHIHVSCQISIQVAVFH